MASKEEPATVDFVVAEDVPLLGKPAAVAAVVVTHSLPAPAPERRWKAHVLNPFGDCSAHDLWWSCASSWVPCLTFGLNMRRAFSLNVFAQAVIYFLLFGGIAHLVRGTVQAECPLFVPNPEYVKLYGEPDFPPPPPGAAFFQHMKDHDDHQHDKKDHRKEPWMQGTETAPEREVMTLEVDIEVTPEPKEAVPMAEIAPATEAVASVVPATAVVEPATVVPAKKAFKAPPLFQNLKELKVDEVSARFQKLKAKAGDKPAKMVASLEKAGVAFPKQIKFDAKNLATKLHEKIAVAKHQRRSLLHFDGSKHHHEDKYERDGVKAFIVNDHCAKYQLFSLIGVAASVAGVFYAAYRRTQMREKFGIPGSKIDDFLSWLFCPCCAMTQESRTLSHHGVVDGEWPVEEPAYAAPPAECVVRP